jgi:hypothetical protein
LLAPRVRRQRVATHGHLIRSPQDARSHRIKEEVAATVAACTVGFTIHEHHKKKEAKKHRRDGNH